MDGSRRSGCIGVIGLVFLLFFVGIGVPWDTNRKQPGRATVMSEIMDYCRSEANTSPDKPAQLWFLRRHKLTVGGTHISVGFGTEEQRIIVRYFAGGKENPAEWRCHFLLVQWENRPERNASTLRYERGGEPFVPQNDQTCLSTAPPQFNRSEDGTTIATLRCDLLWQN